MATFPFNYLHSFKDYVIFVQTYAPDRFHPRESVGPEDQWTLDLAFKGLRLGLEMAVREKGDKPVFITCRQLVDEAFDFYGAGDYRGGFGNLEEVSKTLKKVRTQEIRRSATAQ